MKGNVFLLSKGFASAAGTLGQLDSSDEVS